MRKIYLLVERYEDYGTDVVNVLGAYMNETAANNAVEAWEESHEGSGGELHAYGAYDEEDWSHGERCGECRTDVRVEECQLDETVPSGPACGDSVCSQNYIDTGETECVRPDIWQVIVGNLGTVYSGSDEDAARREYAAYRGRSADGIGRASGEPVTLMHDGDIEEEDGEAPQA